MRPALPAVGKILMSPPVSAMKTFATAALTPGMLTRSSLMWRRGPHRLLDPVVQVVDIVRRGATTCSEHRFGGRAYPSRKSRTRVGDAPNRQANASRGRQISPFRAVRETPIRRSHVKVCLRDEPTHRRPLRSGSAWLKVFLMSLSQAVGVQQSLTAASRREC
jgi:hypothetical protein